MNRTYEIQIGDIIEEFNAAGSSDRKTEKEHTIISVTKTIAKSQHKRFKRIAEGYGKSDELLTKNIDSTNGWSVICYRVKRS